MSALICVLVLLAPEPADEVLQAFREGKDLKVLAAKDDPDPWLVADELCARGEYDAAEAFAKEAPRKATERLADHVVARRGKKEEPTIRTALGAASLALARGDSQEALAVLEALSVEVGSLAEVRIFYGRGIALRGLRRWLEGEGMLVEAAAAAERVGWRRRASEALREAGLCAQERSDTAAALQHLRRSLAHAEANEESKAIADRLNEIAKILLSRGHVREAVETQERARQEMEVRGDRGGLAAVLVNLGTLYHSLGEYAKALECAEHALEIYEGLGARTSMVGVLGNLGLAHQLLGAHGKALQYMERELRLCEEIGDRAGAAKALSNIGAVHRSLGEFPMALECQERARAILEALEDRDGVARTTANIGNVLADVGDYRGALECQARALALFDGIGARGMVARTLGNIGGLHQLLGDLAKALEYHQRALHLMEEFGDLAGAAGTLGNIGNVYFSIGTFSKALASFECQLQMCEKLGDRSGVAGTLASIGGIHQSLGAYDRALQCYQSALDEFEKLGSPLYAARTISNMGSVHWSRGVYREALECYERSLAMLEGLGARAAVAKALGNIGNVHLALGNPAKAVAFQERALKLMEEIGDCKDIARTLVNIGVAHRGLGDGRKALEFGQRGIAIAEKLGARELIVQGEWLLARVHLQQGAPRDAVLHSRRAIDELGTLVGGLEAEQGATARDLFTGLFEAGTEAAVALRDPGELSHFLESGRAGELLEVLQGRKRLWATAIPEPLGMEEAKARAEEALALKRYQKELESGGEIDPLWKEVEATRGRTLDVIARIQRDAKAQAALLYPKADSLEEIQRSLRPDEALVLYGPNVALVMTPKDARIVEFGDLEKTAATFQKAIVNPDERGMNAPPHEQLPFLMKKLSGMVVDALGLGDSVKRLLVCPDGVLAYIPFCALTDREVVYVPSGTVYRLLRGEESKRGRKVLALGDPKTRADPLPASGAEAKAVGDVVLLQEKATISGLRELLSTQERWHAVHFACHGLVDPERPVLSALALTPEGDDDGYLRCLDIYRMKIPADLVMLSACETAKGKVYKTEGVMGWTRAFMFAGAPRVIVSLWKVDDEATKALMTAFYENWKTMPAATALKKAQEQVASEEKWKHPYFWAAWQLWGLAE